MDVLTAVYWVVGILAVGGLAMFGLAVMVVVGMLVLRFARGKAEAAGVDFSDGIDAREREIILGMLTKHKQCKREQEAAVDMVQAAQTALQSNKPTP
jgi:hypothetical protein